MATSLILLIGVAAFSALLVCAWQRWRVRRWESSGQWVLLDSLDVLHPGESWSVSLDQKRDES